MNRDKELIKNTIIIFLGKLCTQFLSFFLLPLYTSFLTTTEYGIVDLIITYISLLVPTITLQLENGIFRFLIDSRNNEKEKEKIISSSLFIVLSIILVLSPLYLLTTSIINFNFKYIILLIIICTIFSNISLQIARGNGDNMGYALGSIISGGTTLVLNLILLVKFNLGIYGMFISILISNLLCFLYLFFREKVYKYINYKSINKNIKQKLLKYSIPLIPNGIIWWIVNISDRTIISILIDAGANGIYAIANKFSNIFIGFYNIYSLSWTEQASIHIKDKDKSEYFSKIIKSSIEVFSSICILLIAVIPLIFNIIIGNSFIEAYKYIPFLMFGTLLNVFSGLLGSIYIAFKNTKEIAKTSILSGIVNIVINLMFTKYIGIWSAVFSTIIAFLITSIYRFIDIQKEVKIKLDYLNILKLLFLFLIVSILYYSNNFYINLFELILSIFIVFIFNKNRIFYILKKGEIYAK